MGLFRELPDRSNRDSYLSKGSLGCSKPILPPVAAWHFISSAAIVARLLLFKETAELGRGEKELGYLNATELTLLIERQLFFPLK